MTADSFDTRLGRLATLADPGRRRLYEFVVQSGGPVNRDEAAAGLGVARHVAKFHLDRLVAAGFLEVEYRRPSGRGGPGAGRPTKLYRRSARGWTVSVPERRYDLAGRILAEAVTSAERTGTPLGEALTAAARRTGIELGAAVRSRVGRRANRSVVWAAGRELLEDHGYEPCDDPGGLALGNCPFEALARDYTELVCGLNLHLMEGLLEGLELPGATARLDPGPGRCCVRLATVNRRSPAAGAES